MKLIRLKIGDKFRSLQNEFEISFRQAIRNEDLLEFHPFCFAGANGSGKSNVLEALSNIFYHLECIINDYPVFAYDAKESTPNAFELEYFIAEGNGKSDLDKLNHILIKKEIGKTPTLSVDGGELIEISKYYGRSFMPDLVVAYSSGENETISLPYLKMKLFQYDQYIHDLKQKVDFQKPKSSLLYIDYEMSQAVLLTILLFFDFEEGKKTGVLSTLEEVVKISGIQQFTINIYNYWQKLVDELESEGLTEVETVLQEPIDQNTDTSQSYIGRIVDNIQNYIDRLSDCATCSYKKGSYTSIDFLIDKNNIQLIRKKFDYDPYKFFSVFQILHSLNERVEENEFKLEVYNSKGFYTDYKRPEYTQFFYFTNYYVSKKAEDGSITNLLLRQLSDGEQQFLHTMGICLMLQNRRTLLLLDEPETHFNPGWRSKFISVLRSTLKAGGDNFLSKDLLLTSHSPFIISDCLPDKVIQFTNVNGEVKAINASDLNFKTFGAGVDYILQKFYGVKSLVSEYSREWIRDVIKNGTDNELKEAIDFVGESNLKQFLFSELYKRNKDANN